jgi:hypothetical protein
MAPATRDKILWAGLALAVFAILSFVGLQQVIKWGARGAGDDARQQFEGDRVEALVKLVDCTDCNMRDRYEAVWALGVIGDRRALPVLRKYHTREECQHGVELCQYELGKAIKKIEGTWNLRASLGYEGTDPTSP